MVAPRTLTFIRVNPWFNIPPAPQPPPIHPVNPVHPVKKHPPLSLCAPGGFAGDRFFFSEHRKTHSYFFRSSENHPLPFPTFGTQTPNSNSSLELELKTRTVRQDSNSNSQLELFEELQKKAPSKRGLLSPSPLKNQDRRRRSL